MYGAFLLYSFCMGSLFPRLPDLQHAMGVAEGALGLALIGTAVGTLISLTFAGPLLERIGYRRAILVLIPLLSLLYATAVMAPAPRLTPSPTSVSPTYDRCGTLLPAPTVEFLISTKVPAFAPSASSVPARR